MSYREMSLKQLFNTWMLIKELRGTGKGKDFVARLATQINHNRDVWLDVTGYGGILQRRKHPNYDFFVKHPTIVKCVFEEEIIRIKEGDRAGSINEWVKKIIYLSMLKNAIKLSDEVSRVPVLSRF